MDEEGLTSIAVHHQEIQASTTFRLNHDRLAAPHIIELFAKFVD